MTSRALLLVALVALAAAPRAQVAAGDPLPLPEQPFPTADGGTRALASVAGPAGLVVVFWSNTCPWGDRYAERLAELVAAFEPAGVGVAFVNSHAPARLEAESAEATRERLAADGLAAPALMDPDGALAAAFGARSAPHAFLFGSDGRLLYDGAIDDSPSSAARVERAWLREALDQSVGGLPVEVQKTQAFGCRLALDPPAAPPPAAP